MKKHYFLIFLLIFTSLNKVALATTIHINNKFISYTETGQGKPLVLIHAFPTDKRLWEPQQEGLKDQFRIISLDLWGFGESSAVDGNAITMTEYADEIKLLLDHLNISKAIIGGESMGGYVALAFLQHYPNQVEGLILSNTQAIADSDETKANREKTALDVLENGSQKLINTFMVKALSADASEDTKAKLYHILSLQKPTTIASALRGMALRSTTNELLKNNELPILIITSDQDKLISPQQSEEMHNLSKNSRLVILQNAGHLSNLEQKNQWNNEVKSLFGEHNVP